MSAPTSFLTQEMQQQAAGVESPPVTMDVEKGAIIRFAEAIGDDSPRYNDEAAARQTRYGGLIAPPTFLRTMRAVGPELPFPVPFDRVLDGGSDWEYFGPVRPGRLGLMIFITTLITYRNQFDEVVATQTSTTIRY